MGHIFTVNLSPEPLTLLMKALTSDPSSCVISLFHRAVWCWTVRPPGSHTEPARWPPSSSLSFASPPSSAPPCVSHIPCGGTRKQAAQRGFNPLLFSSYYICNSGMFTSTLMLHEWNQVTYLFQWNHKCRIILKKPTCSTAQSAKHFIKQTVAFLCQTVLQRANGFDFEEQIGSQLWE